jgi:hypothetical protein
MMALDRALTIEVLRLQEIAKLVMRRSSAKTIRAVNNVLCPTVPHVRELSAPSARQLVRDVGLLPKTVGANVPGAGAPTV